MTVRPERPQSLGRGLAALIPQRTAGQPGPVELPIDRIRVRPAPIGGAFGGKLGISEPLAAAAAVALRRPVRIVFGRSEDFAAANPAPGELIDLLDPQPGDFAIDCTFGDGGHARLVAARIGTRGTLVCIDRDPAAEERFETFAREVACETRFVRADFADGLEQLWDEGAEADIVYLDLGVSSMQIDTWERGFSYSYDAPLDMRMDPGQELSAREIVAEWDERRLAQALRDFGEERHARAIARAIVASPPRRSATRRTMSCSVTMPTRLPSASVTRMLDALPAAIAARAWLSFVVAAAATKRRRMNASTLFVKTSICERRGVFMDARRRRLRSGCASPRRARGGPRAGH